MLRERPLTKLEELSANLLTEEQVANTDISASDAL